MKPLEGITVVELAGLAPVPFCGMILSDFGAKVIRVDRTEIRVFPDNLARGKRSIALNLKDPKGVEILKQLTSTSDVLIDPFRPGVLERMGLGPDVLLKLNPKLIYARLTGFGQSGSYSKMAGHDINYLAVSGVLSKLGRNGSPPVPPSNVLADFAGGGLLCAFGILLALLERLKSGKGQVIDSAMQDGALYLASMMFINKDNFGWSKKHGNNLFDGGAPFYDNYECKDGKYISIGAVENHFWKLALSKLGLENKINPSEQMNQSTWKETKQILTERFKEKTRDEWQQIFDGTDSCVAPVLELDEVEKHHHNSTRDILIKNSQGEIQPAPAPKLSRTPGINKILPSPSDGQHTIEILKEFKFQDSEIQKLLNLGVISTSKL